MQLGTRSRAPSARARERFRTRGRGRPGCACAKRLGWEGLARGPAGARTSLRPHLAVTAAQWRLPYPRRGPSLTCSLTWTASFLVGSLRPPPSRAVRGGAGAGGGAGSQRRGAAAGTSPGPPGGRRGRRGPRQAGRARGSGVDAAWGTTSGGHAARGDGVRGGAARVGAVLGDHPTGRRLPSCGGCRDRRPASVSPRAHQPGGFLPACPGAVPVGAGVHAPCL